MRSRSTASLGLRVTSICGSVRRREEASQVQAERYKTDRLVHRHSLFCGLFAVCHRSRAVAHSPPPVSAVHQGGKTAGRGAGRYDMAETALVAEDFLHFFHQQVHAEGFVEVVIDPETLSPSLVTGALVSGDHDDVGLGAALGGFELLQH